MKSLGVHGQAFGVGFGVSFGGGGITFSGFADASMIASGSVWTSASINPLGPFYGDIKTLTTSVEPYVGVGTPSVLPVGVSLQKGATTGNLFFSGDIGLNDILSIGVHMESSPSGLITSWEMPIAPFTATAQSQYSASALQLVHDLTLLGADALASGRVSIADVIAANAALGYTTTEAGRDRLEALQSYSGYSGKSPSEFSTGDWRNVEIAGNHNATFGPDGWQYESPWDMFGAEA